ncbi:hypothetical protein Pint_30891 [Pistacia integerrima]|uniref:Uncharacterized protein n=1 Tax=Pistacia integerrima TaxID=434235 RepID=A0ACC0XPS3_9ROSI|nr:hypothetical protein Pint_30891 [Pistacia integerrima]
MQDYQSKLSSLSLPDDLVSLCFDPLRFVINPNVCASIVTIKDSDGHLVQSRLIAIDGNRTHAVDCFYFTVLYAAGMVNEFGPESDGALSYIFGLSLNSQVGSTNSRHSALVFGLTGAGVAIFVMTGLLGLYFWWDKKLRRRFYGTRLDSGYSLEEQGSRPKFRPNTGSIWFKIQDLERATDNFSQRNIIGRGGFGVVYKGVLKDGTMVGRIFKDSPSYDVRDNQRYLVYDYMPNGNLDDHLFPSLNDKVGSTKKPLTWPQRKSVILDVAEGLAYLHYGMKPAIYHRDIEATNILPTIADALKMLEGDIEVPPLPDRPISLGHPSFYGDGNAFIISLALGGPQLRPGDMLRVLYKETTFLYLIQRDLRMSQLVYGRG